MQGGVEASPTTLSNARTMGKGAISFNHLPRCADKSFIPSIEIAMNLPFHLIRHASAANGRDRENQQHSQRGDQGNKPLFRAPALPTPHQLNNELPFTVHFRPRLRERF